MTDDELKTAWQRRYLSRVRNVGSDYTFVGDLRAIFVKRNGALRCVVENDAGILHIFSAKGLEICPDHS